MTWETSVFPICYCPMCCVPAVQTTRSSPPIGPSGCRCGLHLVQTFKAQIDREGRSPAACPPPSPPNVDPRQRVRRLRHQTWHAVGATCVSGMLLPCCFTVLLRRHWRPSVSELEPPPPPLPALADIRAELVTVTVPRPPQSRVTDICTKRHIIGTGQKKFIVPRRRRCGRTAA